LRQLIHRLTGRTDQPGVRVAALRANKDAYRKRFVGRSSFAARGGADQDFSGETGAEGR
jgi:hypothetical protein